MNNRTHLAAGAYETKGGFRILAIPGSLREASQNRGLLRAAREVAPPGVEIELFHLGRIPLYDGDVESQGYPEAVRELHEAIRRADALLVATPEYNGSIPGVLKNALDWASRPRSSSALRHKPVALMGASAGRSRTANAQAHLRGVFDHTGSPLLSEPRVLVSGASGAFDADGNLLDPDVREQVRELVQALVDWVRVRPLETAVAGVA